jgi:predicted nucleic-acid-binding protein
MFYKKCIWFLERKLVHFISYPNVSLDESDTISNALNVYAESNLDYADCIVYSHAKSKASDIFSFDKGLLKFFKRNKKE